MAPKSAPKALVLPENTNVIANDSEANTRYKCFIRFVDESYLKETLFVRPTLYLGVLEEFWNSAIVEEVALEICETKQVINCIIKEISISFSEYDINKTFNLLEENINAPATDEKLVDFLDLIHYAAKIDKARLNKKHVRREWSFVYDTMFKLFAGRKTGWDQISYIAQYLVYSLALGRPINVGKLTMKELTRRLGKSPAKSGNKIFFLISAKNKSTKHN